MQQLVWPENEANLAQIKEEEMEYQAVVLKCTIVPYH